MIVLAFFLAFGITLQSIISPYSDGTYKMIFDVLDKAYWPLFGDTNLYSVLDNGNCDAKPDDNSCIDRPRYVISYFLIVIYMMISNVLLLNVLIALFKCVITYSSFCDIMFKFYLL